MTIDPVDFRFMGRIQKNLRQHRGDLEAGVSVPGPTHFDLSNSVFHLYSSKTPTSFPGVACPILRKTLLDLAATRNEDPAATPTLTSKSDLLTCPWCVTNLLTSLARLQPDLSLVLDMAVAAVAAVKKERQGHE